MSVSMSARSGGKVRGRPFAGGAGHTAGPFTVYVANEAGNTVTPIRAASNTAGRPIKVGPAPALIAISPDGQTAYVVGTGSLVPGAAGPGPPAPGPHPAHPPRRG